MDDRPSETTFFKDNRNTLSRLCAPVQAMQEATASEPLTLEEEYENQLSWRDSCDKLTFILCRPVLPGLGQHAHNGGDDDGPASMIGDINFFLSPWDGEDGSSGAVPPSSIGANIPRHCVGEVDVMVAESVERGKGIGRGAVLALLHYIFRNLKGILEEYDTSSDEDLHSDNGGELQLKQFMVKIKQTNTASLALFKSLGFVQEGAVDYFGEVKLVLEHYTRLVSNTPAGYRELEYSRSDP